MPEVSTHPIPVSNVVFSALLGVVLLTPVYVQGVVSQTKISAQDPPVIGRQGRTPPLSDSRITLRLSFDNGVSFNVTQFEGALIRIEGQGQKFGIMAAIDSGHWNHVNAKILRIVLALGKNGSAGIERFEPIGSFDIGPDNTRFPNEELGLTVEVVAIAFVVKSAGGDKRIPQVHTNSSGGGGDGGVCCVTCRDWRVCGCAIENPCGFCCAGSCCAQR